MREGSFLSEHLEPLMRQGPPGFLTSLFKRSVPGAPKLQFPYEIPPFEIEFTPEAEKTLYTATAMLAGGIVLNGIMNYLARNPIR